MWKRQNLIVTSSSSSSEVDFVRLCEDVVGKIEKVLKRKKVLNERNCRLLASKLSAGIAFIREAVQCCEDKPAFVPLLAALYRYYEKAEVLVTQCAEEDWCAAAVFQRGNSASFVDILKHIRAVVKAVETKVLSRATLYAYPMNTSRFMFLYDFAYFDICYDDGDDEQLRGRLEVLASERRNGKFTIFGFFEQVDLTQRLARYLLKKNKLQCTLRNPSSSLEDLKGHLWEKDNEPTRTWGESKFLGAGSGASGVCKTSWLGVPCAKKEFHGEASKAIFMKEASIMARLKHPCIVDFVCCGNGEGKGDRFIAMELMEKSLFDLIEEQKGVHFALDVALDIISQIANGVKYLHEQGVAHRDLKPHNVVVKTLRSPYRKDFYCVKLVDFGTSKSEVEVAKSNMMSYRGVGTTSYRAPEAHPSAHPEGLGKVDWFKADAYSFAMTCAHVLTLKQPYENLHSLSKLYTEILKGERPILPSVCPIEVVNLVKECWSTNRYQRPEFSTIYARLETIIVNNMLVLFPTLWNQMTPLKLSNVGKDVIEDECHSNFFSAQDSLCTQIVSQEWDCKSHVGEQVGSGLGMFYTSKTGRELCVKSRENTNAYVSWFKVAVHLGIIVRKRAAARRAQLEECKKSREITNAYISWFKVVVHLGIVIRKRAAARRAQLEEVGEQVESGLGKFYTSEIERELCVKSRENTNAYISWFKVVVHLGIIIRKRATARRAQLEEVGEQVGSGLGKFYTSEIERELCVKSRENTNAYISWFKVAVRLGIIIRKRAAARRAQLEEDG